MSTTQTKTKFKVGQIIVAPETKRAICGAVLIHKGEIVEVSNPTKDWDDQIKVCRGIKNKASSYRYSIKERFFRESTPEEEKMYMEGKRNISGLC
jgi:hypothetical protein